MSVVVVRILWHSLNFEAEDAEVVHRPRHTVGHHSQILAAYQHTRCLCQHRKFLHRLAIPELIVAAVEIVVIQSVEGIFLVPYKRLVHKVELCRDARMIQILILMVANKQHVANQRIESVSYPDALIVGLALEGFFYLSLCVVLIAHTIQIVVTRLDVLCLYFINVFAKYFVENPVGNERLCHVILAPP